MIKIELFNVNSSFDFCEEKDSFLIILKLLIIFYENILFKNNEELKNILTINNRENTIYIVNLHLLTNVSICSFIK